ncbi:MAG TPA: GGDEF domain-containing protein [Solirubrobacteraceae bacterium]
MAAAIQAAVTIKAAGGAGRTARGRDGLRPGLAVRPPAEPWPAAPETAAAPLHISSSGGGRLERAVASAPTVREATRRGRSTAVLLADVDGFKAINDTRGHAAGDDVLRAMAALLRAAAPAGGRAFRIGGDEFALVFECDGEAQAEQIGWELRSQARDRLGSTLSVGLAVAGTGESDEAVVARADGALYDVKRQGRDGVRLARPA